jgi:translocation and assembly module TamB
VRGPISNPVPLGTFGLSNGTVTIKPLNVQLSAITMNGQLNAQSLSIQQILARAKDGTISGSGTVALKDYQAENFKVSLTASRWPVIDTQRYRAIAAGALELQGPLTRPLLTGLVNVISADLRPDLAFLSRGKTPLQRDETIVIKQTAQAPQPTARDSAGANGTSSELFKNTRLDVSVSMANQVWIRHPDANVELGGKLRVTKAAGRDLALVGTINTVRGWIAFQGRRFNLLRGLVEFRGEQRINPALDIVAQYRLPQYQVEAAVSGTLEKPALVLRSDPNLEQADILALLLFGKPINSLDRTEQSTLQQSAIDIAGGYAATTVATAVSEALGLDRLGVDIRDVDFSGGQVGFGRYIGQSTYISFSQAFSATRGREVSLEYQIGADWKITTSTTTNGASGVGVIWHKRY